MTDTTIDRAAIVRQVQRMQRANAVRLAEIRHDVDLLVWANAERSALIAAHEHAEAVNRAQTDHVATAAPERPGPASAPPDIASVMAPSGDCQALLAKYFPDDLAWAQRVTQRESHCTAGAINNEGCDTSGRTNSHAAGVFQMCVPMHEPTFAAVGCSGRYLDMECNIKAARRLYDGSGRSPWGG